MLLTFVKQKSNNRLVGRQGLRLSNIVDKIYL